MTEYDYSPGAREAYEKKLKGVRRWAKNASRSNLVDPFNSRLSTAGTVDLSYEGPDRPPSPGSTPQQVQKPPPPALAQHRVYAAHDRAPAPGWTAPQKVQRPPPPAPAQHQVYGAHHYHSNISVAAPECYRYAQRGVEIPPIPVPPKHTHGPPPSRSRSRQHIHASSTSLHSRYKQPHQQPRHHHQPRRQVVDINAPQNHRVKPQLYISIPPIIPGVNVPAQPVHYQPQVPPPQVYRQAKAAHSQPYLNINSPVVYGSTVRVAPKKSLISRFTSIFTGGPTKERAIKERATSGAAGGKKKHRHHRDRRSSF